VLVGSAERTRRCAVCQAVYSGTQSFCPIDGGAVVDRVDTEEDPYLGRTIDGRYLVHRRIGRGGMGVVYEAAHIGLDKRIALKFLRDTANDPDALARFRREARIASKIDHENVVNILDVGRDDRGVDYLAMELVDGQDLQQVLAREGAMPAPRAVSVVRQILRGLTAIHEVGIIHRDLKPSNVIVVDGRDGETAKIMDFGISKSMTAVTTDNITETGNVIGTPQYMSPEQLLGDPIDPRSDLFAVGLILYALLAGEPPFQGSTMSRLAAMHASQDVPSLTTYRSDLPAELVAAVARAVARRREDRYPTAEAFERALAAIDLASGAADQGERWMLRTANATPARDPREAATKLDKPPSVAPPADRPITPAPQRSSRARWVAVAVLVAVAAIGGVLYVTRESPRPIAMAPADAVPPDAPGSAITGSGSSAVSDQLALARRADADGKLELAIALYADIVVSSPTPALVFRLGELYERVGKHAEAAASFTRYLELAPTAVDREHVQTRIARLQVKVPVDAGVAVARRPAPTPPKLVDAGVKLPPKKCYCFPGHGSDASHFRLCRGRAQEPTLCRCRGRRLDNHTDGFLCSKPGKTCSGSAVPGCYDALVCDDPDWGKYAIAGVKLGDPCTGYRDTDTPIQGKYACAVCDTALGLVFEGQQGDPCTGYAFNNGDKVEGHLNNCW
jgi:serine/threonine protein kinase